ncbi:WD repeat-containing protein 26 homolog isoform X2 [Nymphaea colorata]|uniref:WD repeat-containing protein 26 homolog isoform X2 n=1 Tax=Nymphaea colorata TaxID=210225 RepID=UPI00214F0D77|nr:WD repeat-containing protein 26 homolog isoform X2 [Nymphaea colorata]
MGGLEDEEPPLKRIKSSPQESRSVLKNLPLIEPIGSSRDTMAKYVRLGDETVGSKGIIKKVEFVRIITRALYSLGYEKSGALLEEESGISLNSSTVNLFRQEVLEGKWDKSVATLGKIAQLEDKIVKSASFLILEQKFFELLQKEQVLDALKTLRLEIAPLCINKDRVHELAGCIVSPARYERLVRDDALHDNPRLRLLEELQKLLPPSVMVPERRLEHLLEQALNVQRESCVFHNSLDSALSLYHDHQCGRDQIPTKTLQSHQDEVWFLKFAHNGKYLASSSRDCTIILWEVSKDGEVSLKHTLMGHQKPVFFVTWSFDDCQLLTCGIEEVVRRWDVESGSCLQVYEKSNFGLVSCGWFPEGKKLFAGMNDRSVCIWDLEGKELEWWKGQRAVKMSDMFIMSDGTVISMNKETTIVLKDGQTRTERVILEDNCITSFSISRDERHLLVNLSNQEIHLWSTVGEPKLLAKYKGHKRTRLDIRSCFGGSEEAFVASGSEDSMVYIWHRGTGKLLEKLPGHSGAVNCVSWNPANPCMLASASDDRTVRIWGISNVSPKLVNACSNNFVINHCNGIR